MISVNAVSITFGQQDVLVDADWHVGVQDRIGLVGPNGAGKSTLLKIIAGVQEPHSGTVNRPSGSSVGDLAQEHDHMHGRTLWEEVLGGRQDILDLEAELRRVEDRLSAEGLDGKELERRLNYYSRLQEQFEEIGGYQVETETAKVLAGLGFARERWHDLTETWSGGWQVRIALAKVLLQQPSYMLLDEPTNYLDLENILWLEEYVKSYPGAVVMVSHDRTFLDNAATRISEVDGGAVSDYNGNYSFYLEEREKRRELLLATAKNQDQKIREMERFVTRWRASARRGSQAQSRLKMLEKVEAERVVIPGQRKKVRMKFPPCRRSGKEVIKARDVAHAYGDHEVFRDGTFTLIRGERAALVGVNGAGKSTMMRLCAGSETPSAGEVSMGLNVDPLYFAQDQSLQLPAGKSVLDAALDGCSPEWRPTIRDLLGAFLFSGDAVDKPTDVLSGGEKNRLCLARLLARHGNLLLLDEPTNHLDMETKEVLVDALQQYNGSMLFVSHDRYFLEHVATKVIEIDNGCVNEYPWPYRDYLDWKEMEAEEAGASR